MPPLKVYWYEGLKKGTTLAPTGATKSAKGAAQNLPPILAELQKQYPDEEFESNGADHGPAAESGAMQSWHHSRCDGVASQNRAKREASGQWFGYHGDIRFRRKLLISEIAPGAS